MPSFMNPDFARRAEVAGFDIHPASGDTVPKNVLDRRRHWTTGLASAEYDNASNVLEIDGSFAHLDHIAVALERSPYRLVWVHGRQRRR
jgi:hypothetical protein